MQPHRKILKFTLLICFCLEISLLQPATATVVEYSSSADNLYSEEPFEEELFEKIETGLEFLSDTKTLQIDRDYFIGRKAFSAERLAENSTLQLVQTFIRKLKDLPMDLLDNQYIGSGKDKDGKKPAWAFFPYRLKTLAKIEARIYKILKKYSKRNKSFLTLESYLLDFEESSLRVMSRFEKKPQGKIDDPYMYIGSHPLLIFRMMRRFAQDLQPILYNFEKDEDLIMSIYHEANPDLEVFPTWDDLYDAMDALVRIQTKMDIKTEDLAKGILEKLNTRIELNALHALEFGAYLIHQKYYDLGLQWIHFAWEKVSTSPIAHRIVTIRDFFLEVLSYAVSEHNKQWEKVHSHNWHMDVFSTMIGNGTLDPTSFTRMFDVKKKEAAEATLRKNAVWDWPIPLNFAHVCSGVNLQTEEEKRNLICWYFQFEHPSMYISPLKVELLNEDPYVMQIYDFIGGKLMKAMKGSAINNLERSTVVDPNDAKKTKVEDIRTSAQAWIFEDHESGHFTRPLTRRLEMLTNLNILPTSVASDAYQVAAYGPSQHYDAHIDSFADPARTVERGNRILTIMGYLSDVAVGGRTGFPILGTFAEPIKGSIVVWESMDKTFNSRDTRTYHGGCPVVLGVKWITNKWVYSKENMFKYPCPAR